MTSPLHLEQQRLGERPARAEDEDAVAALAADDRRVLERLPADVMAARIRAELVRGAFTSSPRARRVVLGPALAACAVVLLAVLVKTPAEGADRPKGTIMGPHLELRVADAAGPRVVRADDVFAKGDVVQISIRAAGAGHGVVVSIDGGGGVTRHFPDDGDTTLPDADAALPFSFELDDAPEFERFILVTSERLVDVEQVLQSARAVAVGPAPKSAPLALPTWVRQYEVVLSKRVVGGATAP
jgi:hypothetical protein